MNYRLSTVVAIVTALVLAPFAFTQETPARPGGGGGIASQPEPRIDQLDFPGGTVVEYVELIRQTMPEANFVVTPDAEQFLMPPMTLRNVLVHNLATLITETATLPEGQGHIQTKSIGKDLFAVQARVLSPRRVQPAPTESLVLSLADIVSDDMRAEDVLSSIETALDVFGDDYPQAAIRYHAATRLLIARGHPEQMFYVNEVVQQLRLGRPRPVLRPGHRPAQTRAHDAIIEQLQQRVTELEAALAELRENE